MKKIGIILVGFGCGIFLYLLFSAFFKKDEYLSPVEEQPGMRVIQQNTLSPKP